MYKDKIAQFSKDTNQTYTLSAPATSKQILQAEKDLGILFPSEVKKMWLESNGVYDDTMVSIIYNLEDIVRWNKQYWGNKDLLEVDIDLSSYLIFGEMGNGDLFLYKIKGKGVIENKIYGWNHEENSITLFAQSFLEYLKKFFNREFYF